jgi:hypothetical protein
MILKHENRECWNHRFAFLMLCTSQAYIWYAVVMVLVYPIGIPSMYAVLLGSKRKVLGSSEAMDREASNDFPNVGHLRFLIDAYKVQIHASVRAQQHSRGICNEAVKFT